MTATSPLARAGTGVEEQVPYPLVLMVRQMTARTAQLAAEHGLRSAADALTASSSQDAEVASRARVVVTGHLGAGSSSLVGALLGLPELLPVDHHGRPHAPVLVRAGTLQRAFVRPSPGVGGGDGDEVQPVRIEEVAQTAIDRAGEGVEVEVELDRPDLAALEIIDAGALAAGPSAGAVVQGYATLGDAVVLTHDVKAPPGEPELAVLRTLAAHSARVYLVLTRTDASADHEPVVAAARRLVTATPGLGSVSVLTTSSHLAATATRLRASGSPLADMAAGTAGVEELARRLRKEVVGRHVAARLLAQAKSCARVAEQIAAAAAPPDDGEGSALAAEQARLSALVAAEPTAKGALQRAVQHLRSVSRADLEDSVRQLKGQLREQIEAAAADDLEGFEDRVRAALAEVVVSVWQTQGDLAAEAAALVGRGWDSHDEPERVRRALLEADLVEAPAGTLEALGARSEATLAAQRARHKEALLRSAGMMLPSMLSPVRAVIGILVAGVLVRGQSKARDAELVSHLRSWVDQACAEAMRGLSTALDARALVAQHHLDQRVVELSGQLRSRLDATGERAKRHRPPPPDPSRAAVARLVQDTRKLITVVADRAAWPGRPAPAAAGAAT